MSWRQKGIEGEDRDAIMTNYSLDLVVQHQIWYFQPQIYLAKVRMMASTAVWDGRREGTRDRSESVRENERVRLRECDNNETFDFY